MDVDGLHRVLHNRSTVLVNFFHLNFILDNTSVLVVAQYY